MMYATGMLLNPKEFAFLSLDQVTLHLFLQCNSTQYFS